MKCSSLSPRRLKIPSLTLGALLTQAFLSLLIQPANVQAQDQTWSDIQAQQSWARQNLAKSPRRNEWVTLQSGSRSIKAWVEYSSAKGKAPVVLVLHEVFGLTDSTRNTADRIAAMGYTVVVPDMLSGYGPNGGDSDSFTEAHAQSKTLVGLSDQAITDDINRWADYGVHLASSNDTFAIVGLSWGGGAAFHYATMANRKDLKAVFVFYDVGPPRETQKYEGAPAQVPVGPIRVPIHGFYPENDTRVMTSLEATQDAMAAANKAFDPVIYKGADHAYMRLGEDPANTNSANKAAVEASLQRLERLLKGM
jgi:carboxymethylenebutenolidase